MPRLIDDILQFVSARIPEHQAANRRYLTIAIGCTGGQHRSVYLAERLAERFAHMQPGVKVRHAALRTRTSLRALGDGNYDEHSLTGGCVCGLVRYQTEGEPLRVTVCHCTGASVAPIGVRRRAGVQRSASKISGGPLSQYRHVSDESGRWLEQQFCPRCGTNIALTLEWRPGLRIIDAGTFDDPSWISAKRHPFR